MISEIDLRTLPKDVLSKLPLSLRISKHIHIFNELPIEIQYLLNSYIENKYHDLNYVDVYDFKPDISVYNDAEPLITNRKTVIEYLMNYLNTVIGSYPFDVNIGNSLKLHLQTKDTSLRQTLLSNELYNIIQSMSNNYNIKIDIVSSSVKLIKYDDRTEAVLDVTLKIDDKKILITVQ